MVASEPPTLADRLAAGPLTLQTALRIAADVAGGLRKLHCKGRAHGGVSAAAVVVQPHGAVLDAAATSQKHPREDVNAFGALLYEVLNDRKYGPDAPPPTPVRKLPVKTYEGVWAGANGLASRCLSPEPPEMRQVLTELRVLTVLARYLPPVPAAGPVALETPAMTTEEQAEPEPAARREEAPVGPCPSCLSQQVFASAPKYGMERVLHRLGAAIRHCRDCHYHYAVIFGVSIGKSVRA